MGRINVTKPGGIIALGEVSNISFSGVAGPGGLWNQFQFDPQNSGHNPVGGPDPGSLGVTSRSHPSLSSQTIPVTDGERIYYTYSDGSDYNIVALSLDGSTEEYDTFIDDQYEIDNPLIPQQDFIYAPGADDSLPIDLLRLSKDDGNVVDRGSASLNTDFQPFTVNEDSIVFADNRLYEYTPSSFTSNQIQNLTNTGVSWARVEDSVIVIERAPTAVGPDNWKLSRYNIDGTSEGTYDPVVIYTRDLCLTQDGTRAMIKADPDTENDTYRVLIDIESMSEVWRVSTTGQSATPGPAYREGVIYAQDTDSNNVLDDSLYAFDLETGATLWENNNLNYSTMSSHPPPALGGSNIYVLEDNKLRVLDLDGNIQQDVSGVVADPVPEGIFINENVVMFSNPNSGQIQIIS